MSWWSDGEKFDEHDPDYCIGCERGFTKAFCDRCQTRRMLEEMERNKWESEDEDEYCQKNVSLR